MGTVASRVHVHVWKDCPDSMLRLHYFPLENLEMKRSEDEAGHGGTWPSHPHWGSLKQAGGKSESSLGYIASSRPG